MKKKSGQGAVPVNRSPSRASKKVLETNGIYGPTFSDSSAPAVPQSSWESRLRERLGMLGSVEWEVIWRKKGMGGRRSISRLAVSGLHTSGIGCIGWPTAAARDWRDPRSNMHGKNARPLNEVAAVAGLLAGWPTARALDGEKNVRTREGSLREIERKGGVQDLCQAAMVAGWPTPRSSPNENRNTKSAPSHGTSHGLTLSGVAQDLKGWPTPTTPSGGQKIAADTSVTGKRVDGSKAQMTLKNVVEIVVAGWKTPTSSDSHGHEYQYSGRKWRVKNLTLAGQSKASVVGWGTPRVTSNGGRGSIKRAGDKKSRLEDQATGTTSSSSDPTPPAPTAVLNPALPRWLLGFTKQWLDSAP